MTGATICSGILAPEVAMPWVDWQWCAEIDPFACALIRHHRPTLPNLGDVTAPDFVSRCAAVDLLVAGTPCQAFSVAGQRKSLDDSRGNITLRLVEIVHAIRPRILLWENVPGVLSTPDNAFGCFLGGLVGASEAVLSAAGWSSAGVVSGPIGTAAWRVLDAQYFGLAQRRQRVFLIFNCGNRPIGPEILFEWEGMRRDSPPSRKTGQRVAPTISARTKGSGGLGTDFDLDGGLIAPPLTGNPYGDHESRKGLLVAFGGNNCKGSIDVATACRAHHSAHLDFESETMIVSPTLRAGGNATGGNRPPGTDVDICESLVVTHYLRAEGFDASEDGTGHGTPLVPITFGIDEEQNVGDDLIGTLKARKDGGGFEAAVAFAERGREHGRNLETQHDLAYALTNPGSGGRTHSRQLLTPQMQVRRLTPTECEILMGFPKKLHRYPISRQASSRWASL